MSAFAPEGVVPPPPPWRPEGLAKGARNIIGHEERGRFLEEVGGESFKVAPGGSLSNTLVALGRPLDPGKGAL